MRRKTGRLGVLLLLLAGISITGCSVERPDNTKVQESTQQSSESGAEATATEEAKGGTGEYHKLSAEEAKARVDSGDAIVVLDVRTAEEYEESHIPGAILIPNEEIGEEPLAELPDLDQEILIYCRSGNRSAQAAEKLLAAGYTNIYDFGGIKDWPYETVSGAYEPTADAGAVQADNAQLSAADGVLGTFTTTTLSGEEVDQDIFTESELTMLNIWGTFCGPCIREMPDLAELAKDYDGKMRIIGLISDVGEAGDETAQEVIDYTGADYTHIVNSADLEAGFMRQIQVVPTTVFLDKEGKQVGKAYTGARSKADWAKIVEDMLKQVGQ